MNNRPYYEKAYYLWNKRKKNAASRKHYRDNRLAYKYHHIKARCKKNGVPFEIDLEDISIPEFCPILDIPLIFGEGKQTPNSPSVDRMDPTKGYVKGNVWVISSKANRMKSDATSDELRKFADWVKTFLP